MDKKEIMIAVGGVALVGVGFLVYKKMSNNSTDAAAMASQDVTQIPAYVPSSTSYTPVGLNNTGKTTTVPGTDPSQVDTSLADLPSLKPPVFSLPTVDLGTAGLNAPGTGMAIQPTDGHSSAPALTGNAAIIDAEYVKLFGRHAEQAGLDYWNNALNSGLNAADLDKQLIKGAQSTDAGAAAVNAPNLVIQYAGK